MNILLTGAGGMLATDLLAVLEARRAHDVTALTQEQLDICDPAAVMDATGACKPDVIVNCAAYTQVDRCETETALAYAVNGEALRGMTQAAVACGAALLHISTDYVFDGAKPEAYVEDDDVNPLSVYGKSKLAGELHVRRYDRHYIVRTQWLYGHSGANFVHTMLRLAKERPEVRVVDDQFGSPTCTRDLALALAELITTGAYGTYHITNAGRTSWYGFAREIFALAGVTTRLTPIATIDYPTPAKRPAFSTLANRNWLALGKPPLRGYREALKDYLETL